MDNIIEQLKKHEADELDAWYEMEDEETEAFQSKLLQWARSNPKDLVTFVEATIPQEFSSLSIIYETISTDSEEWAPLLASEFKRIIALVRDRQSHVDALDLLTDIETDQIAEEQEETFRSMIETLFNALNEAEDEEYNEYILDAIDYHLTFSDFEWLKQHVSYAPWVEMVKKFTKYLNNDLNDSAYDVLETLGEDKKPDDGPNFFKRLFG